ncbi:DoxX family protein [Lentibacillus sediminis]|uniref:DoxX family protein n=1 Tax=Lentibacillus sediminis TaxID=1940529 RepID=UPI001EFCA5A9|nr:DoxX family protein [Lentibacillus sediminis]
MAFYMDMPRWICYAVAYVFITSGLVKLLDGSFREVFAELAFPSPETVLLLVALTEIACGTLIAVRMYLRYAVPPLIVIILGALFLTKVPVLLNQGVLAFAFEARLDIVMLILLLLLWHRVRGKVVN